MINTIPTTGFNVETVTYKKVNLMVWDVGVRPLRRHFYLGTRGLIFVVDSNDRERIDEAALELQRVLRNVEVANAPLLVLANKQDLPNAMNMDEVEERLGLKSLRSRQWFLQSTCATLGDGLCGGLDWMITALKNNPSGVA